jgi:4-amino-4-deoxy-L-arabinose transferase-like glycosyltransferase
MPLPPRWLGIALAAAIALHAALLGVWLSRLLPASNRDMLLPLRELAPVLALVVPLALVAFALFARRAHGAFAAIVLTAACVLVGIGAVATVAIMALSAHVIGASLLDWSGGDGPRAHAARPHGPIPVLVGSAVWIGVVSATLAWHVHYAFVYLLAIAASLAALPAQVRRSIAAALAWLSEETRWSWPERACAALACAVVVLHLVVVAKPEVGYDASAMHLQFAELVAANHRWPFDAARYAWAVMPMGADAAYLAAYLVDGERAARLVNLLFGALLCAATYTMMRMQADRVVALASVCALASTPLWFLESGSLFVEFAWAAFLVAGLASTLAFIADRRAKDVAAAAICFAGAMACKVIGVFWIAPLVAVLAYDLARGGAVGNRRLFAVVVVAAVIGGWPYVNAWVRTGNPVFPFMNALFASPLFPAVDFNNPLYNAPLTATTPYDLVTQSGRFIEGHDGAAGVQWLLLFPLVVGGLFARRRGIRAGLFALAAGFALLVYAQQSYLRYLLPALVLLAVLGAWSLGDWMRPAMARAGLVAVAALVVVVNSSLMPTASWPNTTLCLRCSQDADARRAYVARYAPLRIVADYLNRNLADARVGFFVLNAPAPSGFVGYSRSANWHDAGLFSALAAARTPDDVAAVARRFRLTHAVFVAHSTDPLDRVLLEYRDRDTTPVARIGGYVVAAIAQGDDGKSLSSATGR